MLVLLASIREIFVFIYIEMSQTDAYVSYRMTACLFYTNGKNMAAGFADILRHKSLSNTDVGT